MNNIDFTDDSIEWSARPHRSLWRAVILAARDEALCNEPNKRNYKHRDWKYQALDWWFSGAGCVKIEAKDKKLINMDVNYIEDRKAVFALAGWNEKEWQDRMVRTIMHRNMDKMPCGVSDDFPSAEDAAEYWGDIFDRLDPEEPTEEERERWTDD